MIVESPRTPSLQSNLVSRLYHEPGFSSWEVGDEIPLNAVLGLAMVRYGGSKETLGCRVQFGSNSDASCGTDTFHIYVRISKAEQTKIRD